MILDTNALSALFVGDPDLGALLATGDRHHLPTIVIGEYRYGLMKSRHRDHLGSLLRILIAESIVLPVDESTTHAYAEVRDELRRKGRPIPENDVWIAALARHHRQPVVSRDEHFDEVTDLRRLAW